MAILKVLAIFAVMMIGIAGHLRGVEGALNANTGQNIRGLDSPLTDSEAEQVREIWRAIKAQEIVSWDGEKWLEMSTVDKEKAISQAKEDWETAGYKNIASAEYLIEQIDKYYDYFLQKDSQKAKKEKVGLQLSLSAFFAGMEK